MRFRRPEQCLVQYSVFKNIHGRQQLFGLNEVIDSVRI